MTDARASYAIERILRDNEGADPHVTALEILACLRGHGWRPTNVIPLPDLAAAQPCDEGRVHAIADGVRTALGITKEDHHGHL